MKIFIAGATGAVGHPLVMRLLAEGQEVFGLVRSQEEGNLLVKLGAIPVVANVFDSAAMLQAIRKAQPEAIVDMLTSLPKVYTPQAMNEAADRDWKLRWEGGGNLQKAAQAVGIRRVIIQSSAFWYAPGEGLANEETPFAFDATPGIAEGVKNYSELEKRTLAAKDLEGVSLRLGFLYGPGTWYARDGSLADQVRQQRRYIVGGGHGVWSFVHVEDVAQAISAALTCVPGIYNITNDTPTELCVWLPAYARWLGAPPPPERSIEDEKRVNGPDSVYYATRLRGASNAKAKREFGFRPRPLEWLSA